MIMDLFQGDTLLSQHSKLLCKKFLTSVRQEPKLVFPKEKFMHLLELVRNENEQRVSRDITPLVAPSAELQFLNGETQLEHAVERLGAEWTKCNTLAGPRPRPDLAVGIKSAAFTAEELAKLRNITAPEKPTQFSDGMYFLS